MHEMTMTDMGGCCLMMLLIWAPALFIFVNIKDIEDTFK